jgi:hypothetical protein
MLNNSPENKLDVLVKQTLSSYEVQYNADDWSKMEKMLETTPKASTFKWSYVIYVFIGLALVSAGYLIYDKLASSKSSTKIDSTVVIPQKTMPPATPKVVVQPPAKKITTPVDSTPKVAEKPVNQDSIDAFVTKAEREEEIKRLDDKERADLKADKLETAAKEKKLKKELAAKEKLAKKKADKAAKENELKQRNNAVDEPVFGDMLDSTRGIVRETKENEQTKKTVKENSTKPIGWDNEILKNVNPDSLKKHRTKTPK